MTELRVRKFNELIRVELGKIIFDFLEVKSGILVTITRVITAPDLFSTAVFISVWPDNKSGELFGKLNHSVYKIQQLLNKKLKIRPVPKILFKYDKNPGEASEVEKILKEIEKNKQCEF